MKHQRLPGGTGLTVAAFASALLLTACGTDSSEATSLEGELNACELLPADDVARFLDGKIASSDQSMDRNNGATAFSQCSHKPEGPGNRLTVQVRRSGVSIEHSRQEDADQSRAEDDGTGMAIEMADAIESGQDIEGLGASAYSYEFGATTHVVVYWEKHYSIRVMLSSEALGNEKALQVSKAAARAVIERLQA